MTYENRKTHKLYEVTITRKGRTYLVAKDGDRKSVPEGHLSKSYKKVNGTRTERPEPIPSSVAESFARTSRPDNPDVGVHWHPHRKPPFPIDPPEGRDRFTFYVGGAGALLIALIIFIWAIT